MRNPNGYGSVVKLSGNRRRPYCARKTIGWTDRGTPRYKAIGYYASHEEAMYALSQHNYHKINDDWLDITLEELYHKWSQIEYPKMPQNTAKSHTTAFKHMRDLYTTAYRDINAYQMQKVVDQCGSKRGTQRTIKNLFARLDKFALQLDLIIKKNSELITVVPLDPKVKEPFTDAEINSIWNFSSCKWVDSVLFLLYTGIRISELFMITRERVNLDDMTFTCGVKTTASKNRVIPIHSKIQSIVENRMSQGQEYLFSKDGTALTHNNYRFIWDKIMNNLSLKHTPHDCRHTFRSRLDSAGGNKRCIDLMMGHTSHDIGERVYTHKTLQELRETLELLS